MRPGGGRAPRRRRFALIDAFADAPLQGNPCAVVLDADGLSASEMLAIAKEMNQSETAFMLSSRRCDLKARYFTPEREIPLAGHPTIATVHAALEAGLLDAARSQFRLELNEGPIRIETRRSGGRLSIRMFQRRPVFLETHRPKDVLPLFALRPQDLLPGAPIQTVSTGTRQLMVPLRSHAALRRLALDAPAYREYRDRRGFFSPHFFCLQGLGPGASTFARHLGVAPDTAEDAFTGSATGGMAAYLWKHGLLEKPSFIAEQGHWMGRPGRALVERVGPPQDIEAVVVAGGAVTTVQGELRL